MKTFKQMREDKDIKFGYTFFDMKDVKKFTGLVKGLKGLEILSTEKMKGGQHIIRVQGPRKVVAKANSLALRTMSEETLLLNPILEKNITVIADYDGYGSSNTGMFMKKYKIKIKTMRGGEAKISGKAKDIRKFLDSDDYDQGDADDVAMANPKLNEALGNENPSHRSKPKMDKDGTVHNVPGKKVGSAYNIKPRLDGKTLKFGTVDHEGNIKVMGLKDLLKVLG
tara:strand:- start:1699 stop:2373 length:675 start_codon:yes stop_codon:yes gene_type:complete